MNGRVYDYNLGRFLSVDPFIQDPGNSQSMNPYSYIMNNPLAGTDPSGYQSETKVKEITFKVKVKVKKAHSRIKARDKDVSVTATLTDNGPGNGFTISISASNGVSGAASAATSRAANAATSSDASADIADSASTNGSTGDNKSASHLNTDSNVTHQLGSEVVNGRRYSVTGSFDKKNRSC
jgi:hypothetical protein